MLLLDKIKSQGLTISSSSSILMPLTNYLCTFDPFVSLGINESTNFNSLMAVFQLYWSIENGIFSQKSHQVFRSSIVSQDYLPKLPIATSGYLQVQDTNKSVLKDPNDPNSLTTEVDEVTFTRTRRYYDVPVTLVIWLSSACIAYSPNRDQLLSLIPEGQFLPSILSQFAQKVREASNSSFTYKLGKTIVNHIGNIPEFKNSVLDFEYICTPDGFRKLLSFYTFLSTSEANYVSMIMLTSGEKRCFPQLNSGEQVTHCALDTVPPNNNGISTVVVSSHNSLPSKGFKEANLVDATILGCSVTTELYGKPIALHEINVFKKFDIFAMSEHQIMLYILMRVTGMENNSSHIDDETEQGDDDSQSSEKPNVFVKQKRTGSKFKEAREYGNTKKTKTDFSKFAVNNLVSKILDVFHVIKQNERYEKSRLLNQLVYSSL